MNEQQLKFLIDSAVDDAWSHNDLCANIKSRLHYELLPIIQKSQEDNKPIEFIIGYKNQFDEEYKAIIYAIDISAAIIAFNSENEYSTITYINKG